MALKPKQQRLLIAGSVAAVLALVVVAAALFRREPPPAPQAAAPGGALQVELGTEDPGLDPRRPMRCFVGGQYAGTSTLAECAARNGVSPGALDVGLDPSGQVAAAGDSSVLQPLPGAPTPPAPASAALSPPGAAPAVESPQPGAACWRYAGDWRQLAEDLSLDACVQALFAGRCERPGGASYGRWGSDTLRLVTGRVERSADNRSFRTLVAQPPGDCAIPHVGD